MRKKRFRSMAMLLMVALLSIAALSLKGVRAAKSPPPQAEAMEVDTVTVSATVIGVNYFYRTLTLGKPGGKLKTFAVAKEVVNFDQIRAYDEIKVTAVEALAVFLRRSDAPPSVGEADTVSLAPKGALPGAVMVDAKEVTARIKAVNRKSRQVTLQIAGETRIVKAHRSVDLAKVRAGDDVTVRLTEALAIVVEKP